jgi:serine/threonine protein kinase
MMYDILRTNEKLVIISCDYVSGSVQKVRHALSRLSITRPDERVLGRIAMEFTAQLAAVDTDEQCYELYIHVKSLPSTTTRMEIRDQCRVRLNGPAFEDNPFLLLGNDEIGRPIVVKILKVRDDLSSYEIRKREVERETQACELLQLSDSSSSKALIHAELLTIGIPDSDHCFKALKMPKYNVLIQCASFDTIVIAAQGQRLIEAVEFIHEKGFVHMDIKGANIFVDMNGQWLLGDFGSICPIKSDVTSCTTFFCKEDVIGLEAHPKFDWFMLLVVLMIETLENRHSFVSVLHEKESRLVSEFKLRSLIHAITCEQLRTVVHNIVGRLHEHEYFFL